MLASSASTTIKILVVEDDRTLNKELTVLLTNSGFLVSQCFNGLDAVDIAVQKTFDLILLDIMLPGRDGLAVLNILRNTIATPVIILSAKHAEEERIQGLSAGADDYLAKPFNKEELLLRIDAILRRTMQVPNTSDSIQEMDALIVDKTQARVTVYDNEVNFTPTEISLLWVLMQNKGEVLSKAFLYQTVLNRRYSQYDRSVDMHLSRIRKKLSSHGWEGNRLQTVHSKGFCLS